MKNKELVEVRLEFVAHVYVDKIVKIPREKYEELKDCHYSEVAMEIYDTIQKEIREAELDDSCIDIEEFKLVD
jgi:hypothetical protein